MVVINEETRRIYFGGEQAVGKYIEVKGRPFRVVGVVPNVPAFRVASFADIWMPVSARGTDGYLQYDSIFGHSQALILARNAAAIPLIKEEFADVLTRVEYPSSDNVNLLIGGPETLLEEAARMMFIFRSFDDTDAMILLLSGLGLLFMLLPVVSLININTTRILERASEIGVRKAFGGSSLTLVGQFVVENVILTLLGGAFGLVLTFLVLQILVHQRHCAIRRIPPEPSHLPLRLGDDSGLRSDFRRLPGLENVASAYRRGPQKEEAMIRHLCKLVWNRKRANALTAFQIFISFLIVFITASIAVDNADNYRRPLGFSYENRWVVGFWRDRELPADGEVEAPSRRQVYQALESFDWIESVAAANGSAIPYGSSRYMSTMLDEQPVDFGAVSDEFHEVFDLDLVSGRWFSEEDAALDWEPLVITQPLGEALFGREDPIGQQVEEWKRGEDDARVVGVVSDYRRGGEFSDPSFFVLTRLEDDAYVHFLVKVRPDTTVGGPRANRQAAQGHGSGVPS